MDFDSPAKTTPRRSTRLSMVKQPTSYKEFDLFRACIKEAKTPSKSEKKTTMQEIPRIVINDDEDLK